MNELKNLFISMRSILAAAVANIVPAHEIEDVVQETYVKLCLIKSDKDILHPRSYLYQIAKNIAKDRVKSASFKLVDSIDDHEDILSVDEEDEVYLAAVSHEEFSQFCEAVRFLPLQCRRVFVLRKVDGFSQREVAKQLEIAESTVEKHVGRIMLPQFIGESTVANAPITRASDTDWIGAPGAHTSHFATADCTGLTVSMTQTIGPIFGAKVATPELGFAYAATMGGYLRTGLQNPGERPRTSIAPVIVTQQNKVVMALGAAGGIRIPSAIVQTLSRYIDQGKRLSEAVTAPRVHPLATINKDNERVIDLSAFDAEMDGPGWDESDILYWQNVGFKVNKISKSASFGRIHAIVGQDDKLVGVADPDWEGSANDPVRCSE